MAHHTTTIPELDAGGLRSFGLTTGAIFAGLFGLLFPWVFDRNLPLWPWILFAVLALWALIAPSTLRVVYRGWMRLGLLISRVTTPLVLGIVFYLLIAPVGLVRRLFGRDPMARAFDPDASSYRVESEKYSKENLENPY